MAQRTIVEFIDDLDGGTAEGTVTFALEGVEYEIDLSAEHQEELRTILAPWIEAGRRVGGRRTRSNGSSTPQSGQRRELLEAMRTWGRANGYKVSNRGRVSRELQEAYEQAH